MPYGVYPVPKQRESTKNSGTGATLAVRIRTRVRRDALDRQLADGADAASNAELELRATQLRSTGERTRLAGALVETLGDARRGEPMTLRPRPQRAAARDAADDILALALRLRDGRPVDLIGVAMTARLVDDRSSPMHRDDAGDLRDAIKSALSALDATPERQASSRRTRRDLPHRTTTAESDQRRGRSSGTSAPFGVSKGFGDRIRW